MCGIIGVASGAPGVKVFGRPLGSVLKASLLALEYRGYDSVGFAVIDEGGRLVVRKSKGKIRDVEQRLGFDDYDGLVGLGHTRWATHGAPSDANAHPHTDCRFTVAVVHNGIIHNHEELREELRRGGHVFVSETDTEVVPHLVEELVRRGRTVLGALREAAKRLRGSYALAMITVYEPDRVYFVRNVSPLIIGVGEGALFVASDIPALLPYTSKIIVLEDGDLGYITSREIHIENAEGKVVEWRRRLRVVDWTPEMAMKGGYPHFMLKEIHEQPTALRSTLASVAREVGVVAKSVLEARRVFLTGAGTSFHAALAGEHMLAMMAGVQAQAFVSSEYLRFRKVFREGDLLIALSQSGETIDTLMAVREAKRRGAKVVAVANVMDSTIPRESHATLYTRAGPEIGVAATKTFTAQLLVLLLVAHAVATETGLESRATLEAVSRELESIDTVVQNVIMTHEPRVRRLAERLKGISSAFYLGRGLGLPVSMEGALKIKEVAYVHAEAYPAGESKHGPIALVERGFPVFFSILNDEFRDLMLGNVEEMKARGALTLGLVPRNLEGARGKLDVVLEMPPLTPYVAPIVYSVPYQLIAYYTAVTRGLDPDRPRNLAKTVTVE